MRLPYDSALVTGATGFVGSHLCQALTASGVQVHAAAVGGQLPKAGANAAAITFHQIDIANVSAVTQLLQTIQPPVLFHLAAYGTFGHEQDVARMIQVNIKGTHHLLAAAAAADCQSFVHVGSIKEYGAGRQPITEHDPLCPWDDYAATKTAASFFCRLAAEKYHLPVTVLRLSPVYGPGDDPSRFVPTVIRAALEGTQLTLTTGSFVRNFTYIEDVTAALLRAGTRVFAPGKQAQATYEECNLGSQPAHSFDDIVAAVEAATGCSIAKIIAPLPAASDDSWVVDTAKAQRLLDWRPRFSLREGIARTVTWHRDQRRATP